MSSEGSASEFRLNVLNPDGRDPEQDFRAGVLDPRAHAPVNFHAYAACCGGFFLREVNRAIAEARPVLLLLRGDFRASERALAKLKKAGLPVAVSLKETGLHQIAGQLDDRARLTRFSEIVRAADGYVAPTLEAADLARTLREDAGSVEFIPTPYPLHDPQWDLSRPVAERQGIFLGTREWNVPSRNHAAALLAAKRLGEPVTVYCCEGRREERLLAALDFRPGQLTDPHASGQLPRLFAGGGGPQNRVATRHQFRARPGGGRRAALPAPVCGREWGDRAGGVSRNGAGTSAGWRVCWRRRGVC